jgi:nitroimidazol reductase NimA-like FMN-containing flavoprotein (pyridoxamine 5'-phosphate oxidase superfamily)
VFRTAAGTKLNDLVANEFVAFEVDVRGRTESWSVVVNGRARILTSEDEITQADRAPLPDWIPTAPYVYVAIAPITVRGRRFVQSLFPLRVAR